MGTTALEGDYSRQENAEKKKNQESRKTIQDFARMKCKTGEVILNRLGRRLWEPLAADDGEPAADDG